MARLPIIRRTAHGGAGRAGQKNCTLRRCNHAHAVDRIRLKTVQAGDVEKVLTGPRPFMDIERSQRRLWLIEAAAQTLIHGVSHLCSTLQPSPTSPVSFSCS